MKRFDLSTLLGLGSSIAILSTYLTAPKDHGYAGSVFSWNLTVFFPLLALSCALGITSFVYFVIYLKGEEKKSVLRIMLPAALMLPCISHVGFIAYRFSGLAH